jgi:hypothetical protein
MILEDHLYATLEMTIYTVVFIVYVYSILQGKTKPHFFSWLIWALIAAAAFGAKMTDYRGIGTWPWPPGYAAVTLSIIACLAYVYGEKVFTRFDWITFLIALALIPFWMTSKNPLETSILATLIKTLGLYPTFRKSWIKPAEEKALPFFLLGVAGVVRLVTLQSYALASALYPTAMVLINSGFAGVLLWRRSLLKK